ncbi:MAG TPA: hypothetical protein VGJ15_00535, partial [Pirellulales bacterium]
MMGIGWNRWAIAVASLLVVSVSAVGFAGTDRDAASAASSSNTSSTAPQSPGAQLAAAQLPEATANRIAKLIQQLGSDQYAVRQTAQDELFRLGPEAFDVLTLAENNNDIEISSRVKYLVQLIRIDWVHDTDSLAVKQILTGYDAFSDAGVRLQKLEELALLPPDTVVGPLCRLARYEKSPLLSKQAALLVMRLEEPSAGGWPRRAAAIEAALGGSQRTASRWLHAFVHFQANPSASAAEWDKLVDEELRMLDIAKISPQTEDLLNVELRLADCLHQKLNHPAQAIDLMRRTVGLASSSQSRGLLPLLDWCLRRQVW